MFTRDHFGRRNHDALLDWKLLGLRLPLDRVAQLRLGTLSAGEADNAEFRVVTRKPLADVVGLGVGLSRDSDSSTKPKRRHGCLQKQPGLARARRCLNHRQTPLVGDMLTDLALDRRDLGLNVVDRLFFSAHIFPSFSNRLSSSPAVSFGRRDLAPAGFAWVIQAPGTSEFQIFLFFSREI
jgi:hypothetical protein